VTFETVMSKKNDLKSDIWSSPNISLKDFKDYLFFGALSVQLVFSAYYLTYYYSFGINLAFYIGVQEVLINGVVYIFTSLILFLINILVSSILFFLFSTVILKGRYVQISRMSLVLIFIALSAAARTLWGLGVQGVILGMVFLATALYNLSYLLKENENGTRLAFLEFSIIAIIIVTILAAGFGLASASELKNSNKIFILNEYDFTINGLKYNGLKDEKTVVVGETSDYIFLYNRVSEMTQVVNKKDISDLKTRLALRVVGKFVNQKESINAGQKN